MHCFSFMLTGNVPTILHRTIISPANSRRIPPPISRSNVFLKEIETADPHLLSLTFADVLPASLHAPVYMAAYKAHAGIQAEATRPLASFPPRIFRKVHARTSIRETNVRRFPAPLRLETQVSARLRHLPTSWPRVVKILRIYTLPSNGCEMALAPGPL